MMANQLLSPPEGIPLIKDVLSISSLTPDFFFALWLRVLVKIRADFIRSNCAHLCLWCLSLGPCTFQPASFLGSLGLKTIVLSSSLSKSHFSSQYTAHYILKLRLINTSKIGCITIFLFYLPFTSSVNVNK